MHSSPVDRRGDTELRLSQEQQAYSPLLLALGEHDNDGSVVLPDHSPEVSQRVLQRPLRGDEGIAVMIALQEERELQCVNYQIYIRNTTMCLPDIRNTTMCLPDIRNTTMCLPDIRNTTMCLPDIRNTTMCLPDIRNTTTCLPDIRNTTMCSPDIRNTTMCSPDIRNTTMCLPDIRNTTMCLPDIRNTYINETGVDVV